MKTQVLNEIQSFLGKSIIFHWNCAVGTALQWKIWYFIENLIFSSDFSNISKNEQFSLENHWSVQDLTGKTSFWWYFSQIHQTVASYLLKKVILWKSIIFQWNTLNGTAFKWKNWYFVINSVIWWSSLEMYWTVQDLTGKTSFWWYFSQIYQTVEGSLLKIG